MRRPGLKGLSLPDQRDLRYAYRTFPRLTEVPKVKYLICSPVADQDNLGSCGSFAALYHMAATAVQNDSGPLNLSQLFLYYAYRERYGHVAEDEGVMIRDLLKVLTSVGTCLEEDWPYVLANFARKPPAAAYVNAQVQRIGTYHALYTADDMIQCLASGYGFIGGIGCYESFDSLHTERTGIVAIPGQGERLLGWHALYFGGGYDLNKGMVKFQNSYGNGWGDAGFGWIPIEYLTNLRLAGDFWTVRS